ncbi:MAG: hypothetical protein JSW27_07175 [Phycisphaerales bacterium]|nr:MAG: hypothetical protein JSW27_07175 [Phycisphaerales bacterium]
MKRMLRNTVIAVPLKISQCVLGALIGVVLVSAASGSEVAQEEEWDFTLSPYLWAAGLSGTSTLGPVEADVDASFRDILDALEIGAMLDARLEKGRWALQSNLVWVDLANESTRRLTKTQIEAETWIVELDGHYQVAENLEVLAGIRYYDLSVDADLTGVVTASASGDESWVDPIVGAIISIPLTDRWSFTTRSDIGGFGVGSDLAWQLCGVFDYRVGASNSLVLGWRHLDWDYDESRFDMDTYMTGPVAGISFRF